MSWTIDYKTLIKDLADFFQIKVNEIKSSNEELIRYIYLLYNPLFYRMLDDEEKIELYYE